MDYSIRLLSKTIKERKQNSTQFFFDKYGRGYNKKNFMLVNLHKINIIQIVKDYFSNNENIDKIKLDEIFLETKISPKEFYIIIRSIRVMGLYITSNEYLEKELVKLNEILNLKSIKCENILQEIDKSLLNILKKEYFDFVYDKLIRIPNMNKDVIGLIVKTLI